MQALALAGELRSQLEWQQRTQLALAASAFSAAYLGVVVAKLTPGLHRLSATLPVIAVNVWLPLLFDERTELLSRTAWVFALCWLGSFKALGLCLNRGPLAADWNLLQLVFLYVMPVYPRQDVAGAKAGRLSDSAGRWSDMLQRFAGSIALLAVVCYLLVFVRLPWVVMMYMYAWGLYAFVTALMNGPGALITALLKVELVPPFDKPWLATSLGDFWGRRWNNTTGLLLRALVFDPVLEGRLVRRATHAPPKQAAPAGEGEQAPAVAAASGGGSGGEVRKLVGIAATFAASGLMHEIILEYLIDHTPFYWFTFFFIQAPLTVLEMAVMRALRRNGIQLPWPLRTALCMALMLVTAHFFFFPPLERDTDLAQRVVSAIQANFEAIARELSRAVLGLDRRQAASSL